MWHVASIGYASRGPRTLCRVEFVYIMSFMNGVSHTHTDPLSLHERRHTFHDKTMHDTGTQAYLKRRVDLSCQRHANWHF